MKLMLKDLRCAFADQLYTPGTFPGAPEGTTPAHGLTLIIPPDHEAVQQLDDGYAEVAKLKWKDKGKAIVATCMKDRKKSAWQKEEYTNDEGACYDGFEDMFYLRARNEDAPLIIDQGRREIAKGKSGAPYGGCFVNAQVELYPQDNSFGKGLRCRLLGVQFVRDGDAFTTGAKADINAFENLAVSEEEDNEFA